MENCSLIDPWMYRPELWISEALTFENAALAKALQISITESSSSSGPPPVNAAFPVASPETLSAATSSPSRPTTTTTTTSSSFLLQELAPSVAGATSRRRDPIRCAPVATGRVSKRKSRASKRSATTYINADPANFREMVQRVTGARPGAGAEPGSVLPDSAGPVVKPVPHRAATAASVGNRFGASLLQQICLPTLDTSAFLLDRAAATAGASTAASTGSMTRAAEPGFELEQMLPAFPTLESWGVM